MQKPQKALKAPDAYLKAHKNGTLLHLRVLPNAPGNKIVGLMDGMIRLKLKAPPVEGAATKCCIKYLSGLFRLAKSRIEIVRGLRSREKWIWIKEAEPEVLRKKIEEALALTAPSINRDKTETMAQ